MHSFFLLIMAFAVPLMGMYEGNRILFSLSQGQTEQAIELYQEFQKSKGKHDFALLHQVCHVLLDQGFKSREPEDQLMAIFGAGLAMNDRSFYLLEQGLKSPFPQIQVAALNFLGKSHQDEAYPLINKMMASPYALIRLEAAYQLALIKHPKATAQIESLMQKVDPAAHAVFPQLFALSGDDAALKILRKLMNHTDHEVRIAALISAAGSGRDELLPQIRKLAAQHDIRQQEAAALALGVFQDQPSEPVLRTMAKSVHPNVQIAALTSLYILGSKESIPPLQTYAKQGDLFAIQALGSIPGSEEILASLAKVAQLQIRLNATLALLELKDDRCLNGLFEILLRDSRDLAFTEIATPGKALKARKAIPSAHALGEESELLLELSLQFREEVLVKAIELKEETFLLLANKLFAAKQNELIPMLVTLLVNLDTEKSIALLKQQQQKAGAPLIRAYATLGLVKLKEDNYYRELLKEWILSQKDREMMKFRTFVPFDLRDTYELTPQETSRFLIESIQVLAETQEQDSIDLILHLLKEGHPRNRPVLAGLLLKVAN